ncbi:MAG: alkene reductase [Ignavibacteriaceae bacterium]|nr:alkene reductase [Ignavibacteriaceae bacterium]
MSSLLFSEYNLGSIKLKNRIVMAPMTRSRAINNIPNDIMAEYYKQRSGAGLIITEGTSPSPNGLGYARIPGLFNNEQAKGWHKVTDAVHSEGSHIFVQLMHTGRVSHPLNLPDGAKVLAPSAIGLKGETWTDQKQLQHYPVPQEMTLDEIKSTIEEYVHSAKLAVEAGFDGVELHGANGYLIEQFINPTANQRSDNYGGSPENRIRFAVEVAKKVADAIGPDRLGIRVSPYGAANDMAEYDGIEETYALLARELSKLNLAYMHIVDHSAMGAPKVNPAVKALIRENFTGTIILAGGYDVQRAERDLQDKKGDLIAIGRLFISNPNLVVKLQKNEQLVEADKNTFYSPGEKGYTDYPLN